MLITEHCQDGNIMSFKIRPYHREDLAALYQICLQTADGGADASHLFSDKELIGSYYAAPYGFFEPEVCFMVSFNDQVCGYIVGCKSSLNFAKQCEENWFPALRLQHALKGKMDNTLSERVVSLIHTGYQPRPEYADYPAHLHINLLPNTQGHGLGRQLITTFLDKLRELKVSGVHLEVSTTNRAAISFYEKVGFTVIAEFEHSIGYGMRL